MWTSKSKEWARPTLKNRLQKWLKQESSTFGFQKRKASVTTTEVCDSFVELLQKWDHDVSVSKLILAALEKTVLGSRDDSGERIAKELLVFQHQNASIFGVMHALFERHDDYELRSAIISLLSHMLKRGKNTIKVDGTSRSLFVGMILPFLSDYGDMSQAAEKSFVSLSSVLRDSTDDNEIILSDMQAHIMLEAYARHSEEASVVTAAGTAFGMLACSQNGNVLQLKENAVTCILHSMNLNAKDVALHEVTCSAIASLSDDLEQCTTIVNLGGISLILQSLRNFPESKKIVYGCLYFLENAARESTEPNDASLLFDIFRAMVGHQDDAHVQEVACRAVSRHLENNPTVVAMIGEDDGQLSIHNSVYAAMNIHLDDTYVFQASCGALHDLATASSRLQQFLVARGCYVTIIIHMRENFDHAAIQEWGFRALRALCSENVLQEELLIKYDLLTDIRKTLHVFADNVGVLEEALSLLVCLAADMDIVRRQCLLELTHDRVVEVINTHSDAVPLLKICFEALTVFAASEEQEILCGVLGPVEDIMRRYKFVKELQLTGCILTQLLASLAICENYVACANSVSLICEALVNFRCDIDVQTEAAVALKVLAELDNGLKAIVSLDAYDHLFFIVNSKTLPPVVLEIAAEGLMVIGSNQENRDRMLQWALVHGRMKEAVWLLTKGSNIDGSTQEKLNVIVAAETSNYKMMEFLLENGASHTQEALRVSRSKPDFVMVGVLLRYIGLERKGDSLAWSNLNISELRSEYFTSSFIDEVKESQHYSHDEDWNNHFEVAAASRKKRFPSLEIEPRRQYSLGSFDENSAMDDLSPNSSPGISVKRRRPRSSSGAILPFSNLDPRLEGPVETCTRFVRLDSPSIRNSYPGHPDSLLIPDTNCGSLLPSPTNNDSIPPKRYVLSRAASALPPLFHRSSPESPLGSAKKHNMQKSVSMDIRANLKLESRPCILYADMSFNQISEFDLLLSANRYVKPFFNGLVRLDLRGNSLRKFPKEICYELTSLKDLSLAENELEDFPYEILENRTLEIINLSKNRIKHLDEKQMLSNISVTKFEMDENELNKFPSWIDNLFPALVNLSMARNRIATLIPKPLKLRQLKTLNLAYNKLEAIPTQFFDHCIMLEKIDLTMNNLISLPAQSATTFSRLSHVKLSHNQLKEQAPWYVPKCLLELQNLAYLDISHNKIVQVPSPSMWTSQCIRDLNFDNNRIRKLCLDESASRWSSLTRLSLSHNKIYELPKHVGHLTGLTCLNISYNPLRNVPDEFGNLRNLLTFPLDGLSLKLHPSISEGTAQEMVTFFYSKMKNSVPYLRMKLMVVGKESRGKSSLLRALQGIKKPSFDSATVGIEVKAWNITIPKKYLQKSGSKKINFVLNTWDFAGQEDFHCTHKCFMTSRALYVAVFDASRGPEELQHLRPWLLNINANAPESQVIIVGTHADKIKGKEQRKYLKELQDSIDRFMQNRGMPKYRGFAIVSCLGKNSAIDALRDQIIDTVATCTFNDQVPMEQTVPKSYVQLEDLLAEESERLISAKQIPVISRRTLIKIVQENNLQLENQELNQAVKFLHEVGVIMHFEDPSLKLADCYFIDPEWLSQMMAQVVTVKEINPFVNEQGIIHRQNLPILFRGELFTEAFIDNYLRLMQRFEVIIPLADGTLLIPSKLPGKASGLTKDVANHAINKEGHITRYYKFFYIPVGFWGRIISRLMLFQSPLNSDTDATPLAEYWRDGIFSFWSDERYFIVSTSASLSDTVEIVVPVSQQGYQLLGFLVDHVETLIEEWYPGLTIPDPRGNLPVQRLVPCLRCISLDKEHYFTLDQCIARSYESDMIHCPSHEGDIDLKFLAPDVLFADIDEKYVLSEDKIERDETKDNFIDGGSYGSVYQTRCEGNSVAVKVFKAHGNITPHRFLRQEVTILNQLHHPSLVSMVGVLLRPSRCLVMELAPKGSLRKVLDRDHLSRGMQQRIASQVADGLAFLHNLDIVYRDMKPSNILIFSLSMGIPVNAKITDYGISNCITPQGFCGVSGSPGYRAPEVEKGHWTYNKKADIFSFGVTLYELVTGGKKPFGEVAMYQWEQQNLLLSKRGIKSLTAIGCPDWPDMQNIIVNCLSIMPDDRPTAENISQWLSSADTLCLRREVGVCKGQTVECMAVHKNFNLEDESMELWIGSGDASGHCQISWLSLIGNETKTSGCRGMIVKDERILCMRAIKDNLLLAGTKKGSILVFDAKSHEQLNSVTDLGDSVLCLEMFSFDNHNIVVAGLANGQVAFFNGEDFFNQGVISATSQMEVLQNEEGGPDNHHRHPVTCIQIWRRKCYCGVGGRIAVIDPKRGHVERLISNGGELNKVIIQIAIWKFIWTSSKASSIVHCLDPRTGVLRGSLDCAKVLHERFPNVSQNDGRVLSLYHHKDALWIGCGGGHVIIIDPNSNFKVLAVISRHTSAVRCIIGASGDDKGKPVSLVLTGGIGFLERSQQVDTDGDNFGYVLIWEAELPQQCAYLDQLKKTRRKLMES